MYSEDDLIPISALQHLAFCERQWGLIHLEGLWAENLLTVEGGHLHERADSGETESRGEVRIARGLRLRSLRLGLSGKADVVEFHRLPEIENTQADLRERPAGVRLDRVSGLWLPVPVEYKRGRPKPGRCDEVQLCAQALCLEEMLEVVIPSGALFYGTPRRRYEVSFDAALRKETEELTARLHELTREGKTPAARYEKKCKSCSLESFCLPKATGSRHSAAKYLSLAITDAAGGLREEMT
ncbi:MAG TPA: CRISPR-associated protein Cas4 [archaeon]|nr:CRISPR-associated protein Cas4 [archaeon]